MAADAMSETTPESDSEPDAEPRESQPHVVDDPSQDDEAEDDDD